VRDGRRGFVFAAAALVGFAFFLMEMVWYRMLAPLLGGSTFTFGLILAVALAGIGAGGLLYSTFNKARVATLRAFAITCSLESLLIALPFAIGDGIAVLAILLRGLGSIGFEGYVAGWTVVAAVVVFPAAVVAGFQFPLLIALLGQGRKNVGRDAGAAYAWNTAGAIAGSLAGGFGILPLLTAPGTWMAVAILLVAVALAAMVLSWKLEGSRGSLSVPAALAVGALACFAALGPTAFWRHNPIGAGRAEAAGRQETWRAPMYAERAGILWEREGVESSVALTHAAGLAFLVNGKSDGHFRSDAGTQVMAGLIGAALHPDPRRAFVIGLGTGSTAGWLARVPSIQRVDVAELEPAILHVATLAAPVNGDALRNPRLRVHLGDAREMLLTSKSRYDLIVSEPSNPYRAGVASLFTRDFYRAVEERLNPGGVFVQWVQSYEIETRTVRTVYATLTAVFAHVESWQSQSGDLILVASDTPRSYDADRLRAVVASEPYQSAMHAAWRSESAEGFLARFVGSSAFTRALVEGRDDAINTDDRNVIEFQAARAVGRDTPFEIGDLRAAAAGMEMHRPAIAGSVDWERVGQERLGIYSSNDDAPSVPPGAPPELAGRARAHAEWVRGRVSGALLEWSQCCRSPVNSLETALIAEGAADGMEAPAEAWLDVLAEENRVEATLIRARLRWRQERLDEAAALLVEGYEAYRTDPWPIPAIVARSLSVAELAAAERPDLAPRIHDALSVPFAIYSLDQQRKRTALAIARRLEGACGPRALRSIRAFEPWIPWEKDLLTFRAECYEKGGDPRAKRARRELAEVLASQPEPLLR
jgi:spermidine synthase